MFAPRLAATALCALLFAIGAGQPAYAQSSPAANEIPLEKCDRLPVVKVRVEGAEFRFLVDTGATTFLNLKSFTSGKSKSIQISSWSGTNSTSAREVTLPDLTLGSHRLERLRLPAVDLSPVGEACGGQIDGILGVDLLERLGATIDLPRRVARIGSAVTPPLDSEDEIRRSHFANQQQCLAAFNKADVKAFEECLDPEVILFTPEGEARGRKAMVDYVSALYFSQRPLPRLEIKMRSVRILGTAAWYEYDWTLQMGDTRVTGRGTGICRRHGDRWLLLNMHDSRTDPPATVTAVPAAHP